MAEDYDGMDAGEYGRFKDGVDRDGLLRLVGRLTERIEAHPDDIEALSARGLAYPELGLISNFSFLVGALVREVDERLQAFTRDCERWADCLNQDLRDFMDFRDGGCPPARERPYESSREIGESRQVFTSVFPIS